MRGFRKQRGEFAYTHKKQTGGSGQFARVCGYLEPLPAEAVEAYEFVDDIVGGSMAEDQGKAQARAVLDVTLGVLYSKANKDKKLALNVPSDWDDMLKLMKTYNGLETDKPASAFYTNDFLP